MIIIKKAFIVWHDGMLNKNPYLGYEISNVPVIYALTGNDAKKRATEPYDYSLYGEKPRYIDLNVRRAKNADIVMFEKREMRRSLVKEVLKERERFVKRKEDVDKLPDDTMFYIQNGYVGNSVSWWRLNSCGYTTDITNAQKYTKQEVLEKFVAGREEDIIWCADHVLKNIVQHVDAQYLNNQYSM